jgi:hypothetical protein
VHVLLIVGSAIVFVACLFLFSPRGYVMRRASPYVSSPGDRKKSGDDIMTRPEEGVGSDAEDR